MAEPPRRSPLDGRVPWSLTGGVIELDEVRLLRQVSVRLREPPGAYLAGLAFPLEANRVASTGTVRTLWLGPDEWLVTAPGDAVPELVPRLLRATAVRRAAIVELSSSRTAILVSGRHARSLLQKCCGLDLHPRAFTAGHCAQTLLDRLPVILDQLSTAPVYRVFVRRSSARWLFDWLIDAAAEFADHPAA
jgi:sarcosine oxidase subunit gamma